MSRILSMLFGDHVEFADRRAATRAARREMATLDPQIQQVLKCRDRGDTYAQVAAKTGLKRDKVRQLEAKGLRLLRQPSRRIRQAGGGRP